MIFTQEINGQTEIDREFLKPRGGGASFVGPLDAYSTDLTALWSFKNRLVSSYNSNLLRVREDDGNTEAPIGYLASGAVDVAAEAAHAGANNLFARYAYNQIAAGVDFGQSSASVQPSVDKSTGIVSFNGSDQYMTVENNAAFQPGNGSFTLMVRFKSSGFNTFCGLLSMGSSNTGTGCVQIACRNNNKLTFEMRDAAGGNFFNATELTPTLDEWQTFWCWFDVDAAVGGSSLNGDAGNNTAWAYTVGDFGAYNFVLGAFQNFGIEGGAPWPGDISHVAFWKRKVFAADRAAINTALGGLP